MQVHKETHLFNYGVIVMRVLSVFIICCALLVSGASYTQISRSSEGMARQLVSVRNMIDNFAAAIRARVSVIETEMDAVEGRIDVVEDRMDGFDARVDTVETSLTGLASTVSSLESAVSSVRSSISSHNRRISALENADPTPPPPSTNNCTQRNVSWGACRGLQPAIPHGTTATVRDVAQGDICTNRTQDIGSATYRCNNGTVTRTGQNCARRNVYIASQCETSTPTPTPTPTMSNCSATNLTWSANGQTCSARAIATSHGNGRALTYNQGNVTPGQYNITGSAEFTCVDGTFRRQRGSCTRTRNASAPDNCVAGNVTWRTGTLSCTDRLAATNHNRNRSASFDNNNSTPGQFHKVGNASFRCVDGEFVKQSGTCTRTRNPESRRNCNGGTRTWTAGGQTCTGSIGSIPHGTTGTATDPRGGCNNRDFKSGSATWICNDGRLQLQSSSCIVYGNWGSDCR